MHFRETQRWPVWIHLLIGSVAVFIWYIVFEQLVRGNPVGDAPVSDWMLLVFWLLFGIGLPALFFFSRLETEVRPDGLRVRLFPFHLSFKHFRFTEIAEFESRCYRPVREFGGWGIRWGRGGKAYNISGNQGVQLTFTNGKRLLIGSQKPDDFVRAIQTESGNLSA